MRSAAPGEIIEVPGGGRIVRSAAGKKDRHSKVCTAKGTRDRRVRLAAHTAIRFYDVQDRLGFDRPSKAVDWLMKMAKSAVDALDELPTWKPVTESPNTNLLPPSMESDSIADTIKSFFPVSGEGSSASASMEGVQSMQFQAYQSQDLQLSLQSLQDPIMNQVEEDQHSQFPGATAHIEFGNPSSNGWNLGGYGMFIPPQNQHQLFFSHNSSQVFNQGGALQSNLTTSNQDHGWFSGFRIPARIQGDEDEQDGNVKPFSLSSGSRR